MHLLINFPCNAGNRTRTFPRQLEPTQAVISHFVSGSQRVRKVGGAVRHLE